MPPVSDLMRTNKFSLNSFVYACAIARISSLVRNEMTVKRMSFEVPIPSMLSVGWKEEQERGKWIISTST